ncbi:GNAT family acetyltransferase [Leucobacter luti]|uniref:GNAT family acetyltransferase n=1 Tax=Leucobacter luti TaxID=340320 RepID=UPI003D056387
MNESAHPRKYHLREYVPADADPVIRLWEACGLTRPWNDPRADLARAHAWQPDLLLVAVTLDGSIVGSVMAGYDGHRGWLYYLASDPARRGRGIGRALVAEAERRLAAAGCPKVQLMVRSDNAAVQGFYDSLGYERSDVAVQGKRFPPVSGS